MADTLIKLIENIQNDKRLLEKKYFLKSNMEDTKVNLIDTYIKKEFKNGILYKNFLRVINNEIFNCLVYDLFIYDMVIINLGKKTLNSMVFDLDINSVENNLQIPINKIKNHILNIISVFYNNENIIIMLEVSDNEGRMVIKPKDEKIKSRPNIKFIDFSLYNYIILEPIIN